MNARQLMKIGVPEEACRVAIHAISALATQAQKAGTHVRGKAMEDKITAVVADPTAFKLDPIFAEFAAALLAADSPTPPREPVAYRTWGDAGIDPAAHAQMRESCSLPAAVGGALMPDAHVGYGLPIGGVLAMNNTVVPYAVGVDIACRMKLSILDTPAEQLVQANKFEQFRLALENGTRFGVGQEYKQPFNHPVMDQDWSVTRITRENKDKAWRQLGTSGSGNHFVEFGLLTFQEPIPEFAIEPGEYVALLSHSGSRGTGASVCSTYSAIAQQRLHAKHKDYGRLAWLSLEDEAGQEYWAAMNLMGDYAAANHDTIHRQVAKLLGAKIVAGVENHHNFAWKETHGGREVIVHRKGATPAGVGVLGVIPGSMASPCYVVRGKGNADSFASASHGAGRCMSRTKALEKYSWNAVRKSLEQQGVRVLSAGADEVPGVYKNIDEVMREQRDLVDTIARFDPKIVKMCGDGSKAED